MDLMARATEFEQRKLTHLTTSDRIKASREAKELILSINEIYKKNKHNYLMDMMKRITIKKKKIDRHLR